MQNMGLAAVILLGALQGAPAPNVAKPVLQPVPYTEYLAGFTSMVQEPKQMVINSREEFQTYWSEALGKDPKDTPRAIDFKRYTLVAIHIGPRVTSGYNVFVKSIGRLTPDSVLVTYVEQKPRPLAVVVQHKTSPWVLLRVPLGITQFTYKEIVQTIKYPPVRDNVQPAKPDPDSIPLSQG